MVRSKRQFPVFKNHTRKWKLVSEIKANKKSINSKRRRRKRKQLFDNQEIVPCCFCGCFLDKASATIEHITPLSHGGNWHLKNLELSCNECNQKRGTVSFIFFLHKKKIEINKEMDRIGSL